MRREPKAYVIFAIEYINSRSFIQFKEWSEDMLHSGIRVFMEKATTQERAEKKVKRREGFRDLISAEAPKVIETKWGLDSELPREFMHCNDFHRYFVIPPLTREFNDYDAAWWSCFDGITWDDIKEQVLEFVRNLEEPCFGKKEEEGRGQ